MMPLPSMRPSWTLPDLLSGFAALPLAADVHVDRLTLDTREAGPGGDLKGHFSDRAQVVQALAEWTGWAPKGLDA
jgi:hypothetical protein